MDRTIIFSTNTITVSVFTPRIKNLTMLYKILFIIGTFMMEEEVVLEVFHMFIKNTNTLFSLYFFFAKNRETFATLKRKFQTSHSVYLYTFDLLYLSASPSA